MIALVMDAALMLLLVLAVGFGIRLDRRLKALREGQAAFAGAVTDLNQAAARAEAALGSLRAAGQETDLLHDRIVRARELKGELERLIARGADMSPQRAGPGPDHASAPSPPARATTPPPTARSTIGGQKPATAPVAPADRMALLAQRIQALADPAAVGERGEVAAIVRALSGNHAVEPKPNRTMRAVDDDLFAA